MACFSQISITREVPVEVQKVNLNVVKTANPTQVNEPGGSVQFTVTVTNPETVVSVDLTELVDDPDNDPNTINSITFNSTSTPTLATICGNNTHLDPGESTTCTFTRNISGNAGQSFTDKACVSGTDSNTPANPVGPTCATASVSIKDVKPTATVAKTVEELVCAQVQYKVKVDNTDTAESLQLTQLEDNKFGNIATVQGDVVATDCSVPQTIAASGSYECKFTAEFCGASTHTNHVTGTLNDNEGNTITPTSTPDTSVTVTTTSP